VTEFARNQVLVQASNAMLVQVNVTSIGVLSLL
jgi:flagellin-like hook-associated protein FlgL